MTGDADRLPVLRYLCFSAIRLLSRRADDPASVPVSVLLIYGLVSIDPRLIASRFDAVADDLLAMMPRGSRFVLPSSRSAWLSLPSRNALGEARQVGPSRRRRRAHRDGFA